MRTFALIIILLSLPAFVAASSQEGFALKYENKLDREVKIEISSFFSSNFDESKPLAFTESLMDKKEVVTLSPHEIRKVMYYTNVKAYWIKWRVIEPLSLSNMSGLLEPLNNKRYLIIE